MTHTTPEWEKRFDERWDRLTPSGGFMLEDGDRRSAHFIKSFIRKVEAVAYERGRAEERAKVREVVEEKRHEVSDDWGDPRRLGAHTALTDLLTTLEESEDKE